MEKTSFLKTFLFKKSQNVNLQRESTHEPDPQGMSSISKERPLINPTLNRTRWFRQINRFKALFKQRNSCRKGRWSFHLISPSWRNRLIICRVWHLQRRIWCSFKTSKTSTVPSNPLRRFNSKYKKVSRWNTNSSKSFRDIRTSTTWWTNV